MAKIHMKQNIYFLINEHESIGLKHCNHPKAFIEYSNDMQDVESIEILRITFQKRKEV